MPSPAMLTGAIYEAEILSSTVVAALEGLRTMPAAQPVTEQIGGILKLAEELSALVDQIGDAAREENGHAA
jgi:hypothetical protein